MGIHSTLLSSTPDENGEPLIEVFTGAWPRSWDCAFKLLARGGFLVESSVGNHELEFVQIESTLGGQCRIRNPWPQKETVAWRKGAKAETLHGDLLEFETAKAETVLLLPSDVDPAKIETRIPQGS